LYPPFINHVSASLTLALVWTILTGIRNPDLTNNSAPYLQSWLQVFKQDKTMVVKAASQAQKAVNFILSAQFGNTHTVI